MKNVVETILALKTGAFGIDGRIKISNSGIPQIPQPLEIDPVDRHPKIRINDGKSASRKKS